MTTPTCSKFPSIDQFRNTVKNIRNQCSYDGIDEEGKAKFKRVDNFPTLDFFGTVKAHGTNAAIRHDSETSDILFQSRERIITPLDDNAGFATHFHTRQQYVRDLLDGYRAVFGTPNDPVIIYGEWCGGNIQKGVALAELPKMFIIFAIRIGIDENTTWIRGDNVDFDVPFVPSDPSVRLITEFPTYRLTVDLNNPEYAQNKLVELTDEVEQECPIGKTFFSPLNGALVSFINNEIVSDVYLPPSIRNNLKSVMSTENNSITLSF